MNPTYKTVWTRAGSSLLISVLEKTQLTGAIDVKMNRYFLEENSSFKVLGLTFSSKLDLGPYIISNAKTASKKIRALIRSVKFLSPEVALYLYKSTIRPCMEYCCRIRAGAPSCFLELLDKLQKRICRAAGSSLAVSLQLLAYRQNIASLSLILEGALLVILVDCLIFLSPFLGVTMMSMSTVSFLAQPDSEILCL